MESRAPDYDLPGQNAAGIRMVQPAFRISVALNLSRPGAESN
jgi:hypothetical protein